MVCAASEKLTVPEVRFMSVGHLQLDDTVSWRHARMDNASIDVEDAVWRDWLSLGNREVMSIVISPWAFCVRYFFVFQHGHCCIERLS